MSGLRSKSKITYILIMFCPLFFSCSSDENEGTDPYKSLNLKSGYINIYYKENKTELREIIANYYLNSNRDTLGIVYTGYIDKTFSIVNNSVSLYISNDSKLDRITYNYSLTGTNIATQYENHSDKYDDKSTLLKLNSSVTNKILRGQFKGILFNGMEAISVDSCIFYIER